MKNNSFFEVMIVVVLFILLILVINPMNFWMPNMMHIMVIAALVVIFGIFATFILREKVADEREGVHRMLAGRAAFLAGSSFLIVAIAVQGYKDQLDIWLVATLVVMLIVKIGTRIYTDLKR